MIVPSQAVGRWVTAILLAVFFTLADYQAIAQDASPAIGVGVSPKRVVLPSSTHPAARSASDLGRMDGSVPMDRMILTLAGNSGQGQSLQALLENLHTK